jgi:hypothetical protein
MTLNFSNEGLLTMILVGLTVWLAIARNRIRLENNWPLVYYLLLVLYQKRYPDNIEPIWVYIGVVTALFLRFEFVGGIVTKFLRGVELVVLAYITWRCLGVIFL